MSLPKISSPKELAKILGVSDKQVRNVLRDVCDETPGSGGRWDLSEQNTEMTTEQWVEVYKTRRTRKSVAAKPLI